MEFFRDLNAILELDEYQKPFERHEILAEIILEICLEFLVASDLLERSSQTERKWNV